MSPMQYIKRLVLFAFILKVTSHPTPYGDRLINFLDSGDGDAIGGGRRVYSGNHYDDENDRRHHPHHHHQKNVETGSDSSLVEISFQPLTALESVSTSPVYPLAGKQFLDENPPSPSAPAPNLSTNRQSYALNMRQRQTHHRPLLPLEDDQRRHQQRYPADASNEDTITAFLSSPGLNEISYPEEDEAEVRRDLKSGEEINERGGSNNAWDIIKRQQHPFSLSPTDEQLLFSYIDGDANNKRNALAAFKRQKFKSHQTQFIPSVSIGAMSNLGEFFKNLKNNIEHMEKGKFSGSEEQILEGDHPITLFREELENDGVKPTGTAAFLHAIRTYRPSQRIRSLVALNPEGYHGSQFLDPNYMWVGLGKRK